MKIVLFIFITILFLLVLTLIPIRVWAKFVLDIESKSVYFSLKAGVIVLSHGKIYLLDDFTPSVITHTAFFMKGEQSNIEKYYILTSVFKRVKIKEVVVLTDGGIENDAFLTSMIIGSLNAFFNSLAPLSKGTQIHYDIRVSPIYDDSNLNIAGKTKVTINILSLVVALVQAKLKSNKYKKEKRYV